MGETHCCLVWWYTVPSGQPQPGTHDSGGGQSGSGVWQVGKQDGEQDTGCNPPVQAIHNDI